VYYLDVKHVVFEFKCHRRVKTLLTYMTIKWSRMVINKHIDNHSADDSLVELLDRSNE
jgi:hypothetical protein